MYCKLIDAVASPQTLNLCRTAANGRLLYTTARMNPGVKYDKIRFSDGKEIALSEDPLLVESLKKATMSQRKPNREVKKLLDSLGIEYTVSRCPSCRGVVEKIEYQIVEVVE